MAFVSWNDSYSVNIKQIDEQHKRLFTIVNELFDAMKNGKGNDVLGNVLRELADYTRLHFATEENLMRIHNYPKYNGHKMEHDRLVRQVKDLTNQFENGNAALTIKVSNFLKEWLLNHIQKSDQEYSTYFKKINVI